VGAAGSQSQHHVAALMVLPVMILSFHRAYREAGQSYSRPVHAGHFRRFAADQRAAGLFAAAAMLDDVGAVATSSLPQASSRGRTAVPRPAPGCR